MKRLTKKEELPRVPCYVEVQEEHWKTKHRQQAIDKLGQLEDIEEELGIDLITLFKALKQGYIYYPIDYPDDCFKYEIEYLNYHNYWYLYVADGVGEVYFEDYGKTWALTREELENDK